MVLVHKGKVLTDDVTLAAAGVTEASFIVVMQQKPKAPKPPPRPRPRPPPRPHSSDPAAPPATTPEPPAAPAPAPAPEGGAPTPRRPRPLVAGAQLEETITNMMAMGFEREMCVKALRAAFNNPIAR